MSIEKIIASIEGLSEDNRRKMRANAVRMKAGGTALQQAQAARVIEALDARRHAEIAALNAALSAMTIAARIVAAFRRRPPTLTEETVIRALLDNPASTSTELSSACGWKGQVWHAHFGKMAKAREADLWLAEASVTRGASFYCGILADLDPDGNRFTIKADVAAAFAELGIAAAARPATDPAAVT